MRLSITFIHEKGFFQHTESVSEQLVKIINIIQMQRNVFCQKISYFK